MVTEAGFPTTPKELGRELRRVRESTGLSMEDIASETKISMRILVALEEGNFQYLPDKVFSMNFVRQYGRLVGMDEERLVEAFGEAWERFQLASGSHPVILAVAPEPRRSIRWGLVIPSTLAVIGLVVAAVVIWRTWHQPRQVPGVRPVVTAAPTLPSPSPLAPSPESAPALPMESPTPDLPPESPGTVSFTVTVAPLGECWLRYRDTTGKTARETLGSGQTRSYRLPYPVRLTLGNAGVVSVEVGGKRFTGLGRPGQVVHLEVTPEGLTRLRSGSSHD